MLRLLLASLVGAALGGPGGGDSSPAAIALTGESHLEDLVSSLPSGGAVFVRMYMNG